MALGQSAADRPGFDAVSIRASAPDARGGGFNLSPGRLTAKNRNLKDLVAFAYHLHDYQLSGGPGWTDTERYEIVATFPATTTDEQRARMMQAMLADRFSLVIRRDSKEISGYALVAGKYGPKLHVADGSEHGMMLGRDQATGQRTLTANSAKLADLASILADLLNRPVEDKTQLAGIFDFKMEWTPGSVGEGLMKEAAEKQEPPADGQTGPSIFTALQESLGLKLETRKISVETIVIDQAEKASGN
jgi:uncharacterized protein (TIGR03435 family)